MKDGEPAHLSRGRSTRERALQYATAVAIEEGLEALTIGRVADAVNISKAGLLGHFGSKEGLQLETLRAGAQRFAQAVLAGGVENRPGLPALLELLDLWVDHVTQQRGGCFFASVAAEFDARLGPVRDLIASLVQSWVGELTRRIEDPVEVGHLHTRAGTPRELAYRLYGCELVLNLRTQLLDDPRAKSEARSAMRAVLRDAATPSGQRILQRSRRKS